MRATMFCAHVRKSKLRYGYAIEDAERKRQKNKPTWIWCDFQVCDGNRIFTRNVIEVRNLLYVTYDIKHQNNGCYISNMIIPVRNCMYSMSYTEPLRTNRNMEWPEICEVTAMT